MPRVRVLFLVVALGMPACVGPCAEPPPSTPATRTPPSEPAVGTTEERAAPPVEIDAAALASDLGSENEATRAAAAERLEVLPLPVRVEVLRTGLRMEGRPAVEAALRMEWTWLDDGEAGRVVRLLWPELGTPGREVPFEEVRSMIGSAELGHLLEHLPQPLQEEPEYILGNLHRQMRAEHLPAFARLTASEDPRVRAAAFENLVLGIDRTDRHREVAARAILALWPVPDEPRLEGEADGSGYPPLLAEALRCLMVHWGDGDGLRGRTAEKGVAEKQWEWARFETERWLRRWTLDETAGERDLPLLISLARTDRWQARALAARALGAFREKDGRETLEALVRLGDKGVTELALGSLVRRGDRTALAKLESRAPGSPAALANLLESAPERGVALLERRILGPDLDAAHATLDTLAEAIDEDAPWLGIAWRDGLLASLAAAALASGADGWRLARVGAIVPDCRTVALAQAANRRLRAGRADDRLAEALRLDSLALAYLEVVDPDGMRTWLRTWASDEDETTRTFALGALLRIGDPESAKALVAWVEDETRLDSHEPRLELLLARTRAPEVGAWLRKLAAERGDAGPLAIWLGLHPAVVEAIEEMEHVTDGDRDRFAEQVLAGRPVDGLVEILRAHPDEPFWEVGLVDDDRVRAYLERLRRRRHLGQYAYATGELAILGDAAARGETWRVMRAGRYRWVDDAGARVMTLGEDLTTIPFWISELETNCCRGATAGVVFDELFGIDVDHHHAVTAAERMRLWWARNGSNLGPSRIAEHLVPGAR